MLVPYRGCLPQGANRKFLCGRYSLFVRVTCLTESRSVRDTPFCTHLLPLRVCRITCSEKIQLSLRSWIKASVLMLVADSPRGCQRDVFHSCEPKTKKNSFLAGTVQCNAALARIMPNCPLQSHTFYWSRAVLCCQIVSRCIGVNRTRLCSGVNSSPPRLTAFVKITFNQTDLDHIKKEIQNNHDDNDEQASAYHPSRAPP